MRLRAVAQGRWLLKGGFALDLRLGARARSTKDVDIEWRGNDEEIVDVLLDAVGHDAGDFFELAIERTGVPEDRLGGSQRFGVSVSLAGRPFEIFLLDVGFRSDETLSTTLLRSEDLLGFAGLEPAEIDAIPLARLHASIQGRARQHQAQKSHRPGSDRRWIAEGAGRSGR